MFCLRAIVVRRSLAVVFESRMTFADKNVNKIRKEPGEPRNIKREAVLRTRLQRLMYWRGRSHEALSLPEQHRSELIEW